MDIPRMIANPMSHHKAVNDSCRYSGPEPQSLPLPPELVVRTLSYLDQTCDKKNARLVCKGFAAAGLYSLTSTVYFSTSLIQIGCLSKVPQFSSPTRDIAMHPVVSKYITKLICDGTLLPIPYLILETFQEWWATLGKDQMPWPIQHIHSIYALRYRQEAFIIGRNEDRKIFRTALEQFVGLKCIVFTDVAADEQSRGLPRPAWPWTAPGGDPWGPSSPYHSFAMCIRSLSEMAIKLHELSVEGSNPMSHSVFSRLSPQDSNHLLNVFANLRKISLNINTHRDTYPLSSYGIGRFLIHATLMQSLDLKCSASIRQTRLSLSRVFENVTWPNLKHFGLQGFTMSTNLELIAFFDRHRATIDSVALRSVFLHQRDINSIDRSACEAWKQLFGELRKRLIKFQNLELFQIHDCCNLKGEHPDLANRADGGSRVLQYLHDGGTNPLTSITVSEVSGARE